MTDTTTLAPTDAEILDAAEDFRSQYTHGGTTFDEFDEIGFARAVLAKWGAPAPASDQWRRLFGDVAELVKCLPSSFPDANGHVFKKLRALVEQAPSDGADMPEHWSVVVNIGGKDDPLLTIGHNWLSGARDPTEADTQAIIGAAQHLLAFVGYGLPPTSFDPDEAAPQQAAPASNESAYQRGYMDGMAKSRRDAGAAPQQEAQEPVASVHRDT